MTQANLSTEHRLAHTEVRLEGAKGKVGRGGKGWDFGTGRYTLLYIGRINNTLMYYSTGNYIQYPVINHNGKEY